MTKSSRLDPEKYTRLKAEVQKLYRGLRQFLYLGLGAWGSIKFNQVHLIFVTLQASAGSLPYWGGLGVGFGVPLLPLCGL
jgi:hypothetical protein